MNDAAVMRYMNARVAKLEQELGSARSELDRMRARPALPTQQEEYVLGEMEIVNRQLECKHDCLDLMSSRPVLFLFTPLVLSQVLFKISRRSRLAWLSS